MSKILCFFLGHKLEHISNWYDIGPHRTGTNGRGLWQCTRCMKVHMNASSDFFDKREKKTPTI